MGKMGRRLYRSEDPIIVDKSAKWRVNFMDWESTRPEEGRGLTISIVGLLDEIGNAVSRKAKVVAPSLEDCKTKSVPFALAVKQ